MFPVAFRASLPISAVVQPVTSVQTVEAQFVLLHQVPSLLKVKCLERITLIEIMFLLQCLHVFVFVSALSAGFGGVVSATVALFKVGFASVKFPDVASVFEAFELSFIFFSSELDLSPIFSPVSFATFPCQCSSSKSMHGLE